MKNRIYKIFALAFIGVSVMSCESFLGGDFNDNPNKVTSVSLSSLLPTAIESTSDLHYKVAFTTSQVTQHMYGGGASDHAVFTLSSSWSETYLVGMNTLNQIMTQAEEEGNMQYKGMAQVLMALNLGIVTDTWEAAPYTDAFKGSEIPKPVYDSQESLYGVINALLNDAIINLGTTAVEGFEPGEDDMIYGGDMASWIMAAQAFKARYALHLGNNSDAISAVGSAFTSNGNDFQLNYNAVNKNPWHVTPVLANNTGNITIYPGAYFINNLNGVNFPFATLTEDPRIGVIVDYAPGATAPLRGGLLDGTDGGNSNLYDYTYYTTESAPNIMMSFAELKFIESEAQLASGNATAAYAAYIEGITANMDKVGVAGADRDAYLADVGAVAADASSLTLAYVMKEKHIAMFLNPEAWVDMRRHEYATSAYPNLAPPPADIQNPELPTGSYPQRALYPSDEYNRNADNVGAVTKEFGAKMWRDQ